MRYQVFNQFLENNSMFVLLTIFMIAISYNFWYNHFAKVNKFNDNELMVRWVKVQQIKQRMNK